MAGQSAHLDNAGFEKLYAEHTAEKPAVSWDLGAPQPVVVVELAGRGAFGGDVLEVGCGFGENAMFLAGRGLRVTGVDGAPSAIARARETAAERGVDVTFGVADALVADRGRGGTRPAADVAPQRHRRPA
ncbi:class I SAM-dependent methyltransferase [Catenuloplanes indicus]|uniref:2-polyprenyl-3-methyl-5-hydroxy-6-metoxy-1, 4-benzoquinol methylase n=1 Tax=Catenuloplanes indicus TaxID=137267 RepID=A0AAE4AYQ7_9ACTN|nr:class I SAM-dependent methyltransferase [Catenuloplanes indicus]MDQ0365268.1 2-polyprenyl-3-methyl-5-hydroxy-6-metoxy-1,4-benzoquinol methylase [Catenuloplanes indicus]